MTLPTASPLQKAGDAGQQEIPFPPAPIEELLRLFVKAVRAHQLYLPNNPVYKGAFEAVRAAFTPVWKQTDQLALKFSETEILWYGHPVLTETTKSADSLPWTFFKDGLREIQLQPGFEDEELIKLFDILHRVRRAAPEEDDLLTMLWQADFANLRYRYVDIGAEPVAALADGSEPPAEKSSQEIQSAVREATTESQPALVNMQDFDATLYFLDEKELDYLRREVELEYASDLRRNVLSILLDIFEAQRSVEIRAEIMELVENLMLLFLASGQFRAVAYLLAEAQVSVGRAADLTPEQRDRLGKLPERLSAPEAVTQLLQTLDESADLPAQAELTELFEQLRASALGTIFAFLPRLQNPKIRVLVEQAGERLATSNSAELVKLIQSSQRTIALEAMRRAGAMKTPPAVPALAKVLVDSPDVSLRQAAVHALADIGSPGALQALERSIEDPDRDVRIAAVRTLGAKAYRGVFQRLETQVKAKSLKSANLSEKMAFFEAYGSMCGDGGIAFLDGLLNGKGMFGKREDAEVRACAAIALGKVGSSRVDLQACKLEYSIVSPK